ncbi:MAG: helix-turn-helix domain-containing protein, partial [Cellulosilyticum sp.]|nr:helix-turn-helix domain-containing protein [Cellulosilyticum sp.]
IEQAIRLLNTSNLSVQEIAERVGILELNYFSKLFKKKVGMSPTEYKKLIK